MKVFFLLVTLMASLVHAQIGPTVLVDVPGYGRLRGTEEQSANTNRPFFAFRSVHYAEQPTGNTRFLPPIPKAPYPADEIVDATRNNVGCTQPQGTGKEDCLTLNIFTPTITGGQLPVLFWIHGGSYLIGQAAESIPTRFMEKNMIVVATQYRLGPLGFLCFDTDEVPGNAGIFDQIEALLWVNKNIHAFGGDPRRITIAGQSAGSASVSLLLLAPQARGLFHQSISESGSVLGGWALDTDDRGKNASIEVARLAGCPTEPYQALLDCVRSIDADLLTQTYYNYLTYSTSYGKFESTGSRPVIQRAGAQRIIERPPRELLAEGNVARVPSMWGANKQEGSLFLGNFYTSFLVPNSLHNDSDYLKNNITYDILRKELRIENPSAELVAEYESRYLVGAEMGNFESMTPGLTDMFSVLHMKAPTYEYAQAISGYNSTYFYSFNYLGRHSTFDFVFSKDPPPIPHGVCHSDELIYLWVIAFRENNTIRQLNVSEQVFSDQMIQVWSNFVIHGNPTPAGEPLLPGIPTFSPYKRTDERYMAIDETWEVRVDYTQTYTVTVDELPKPFAKLLPIEASPTAGSVQ